MVLAFPSNPAVGQVYQQWTWDGAKWVCTCVGITPQPPSPGGDLVPVNQVVMTNSGQYTPHANLVSAIVEIVGGGGAGAGVQTSPTASLAGGGGGSGAYTRAVFAAAQIGSGQIVTIGSGGIGVAGGAAGGNGSPTSFGTLINAPGGFGGAASIQGGPGAPAMTSPPLGVLALPGSAGSAGNDLAANSWIVGGTGSASYFQGNAAGPEVGPGAIAPGNPGTFGAGGSGAASSSNASTAPGGNGGNGLCVITEYIAA